MIEARSLDVDKISRCGDATNSRWGDDLNVFQCLLNSLQRSFLSQNFQRFKQRRRILAAANSYADGLEHLSRLHSQLLSGGAQSLIQRIVFELDFGQNFLRASSELSAPWPCLPFAG